MSPINRMVLQKICNLSAKISRNCKYKSCPEISHNFQVPSNKAGTVIVAWNTNIDIWVYVCVCWNTWLYINTCTNPITVNLGMAEAQHSEEEKALKVT